MERSVARGIGISIVESTSVGRPIQIAMQMQFEIGYKIYIRAGRRSAPARSVSVPARFDE